MPITDNPNSAFARDAWLRALKRTAVIEREPEVTLPVLVERLAERFDAAPALVSSEARLSYRQLSARCRQYSRWALDRGLRAGDAVCLIMPNCAEYMAVWLGLSRIGIAVALVNPELRAGVLAHSLKLVAPKLVIVAGALAPGLAAILTAAENPEVWVHGQCSEDFAPLQPALEFFPTEALTPAESGAPSIDATGLYLYTSGTTGLPKAARVSHYRILQWSHWFAGLLDTGPGDRMYDCLPLYHSVGGVVATGATLLGGGAVVIRARFSASDFWRDLRAERCTLFQYIGELCRYLVNSPWQPCETGHELRLACGNGLRPEVWEPFRTRFKIPRILEYYASTEGNFSLYNCEGEPGAIGRIPAYLTHRLPVALLRVTDSGEPKRNGSGFCEACATHEAGEAIGLIPPGAGRVGRFEGYVEPGAAAHAANYATADAAASTAAHAADHATADAAASTTVHAADHATADSAASTAAHAADHATADAAAPTAARAADHPPDQSAARATALKVLHNVFRNGDSWYRTGDLMRRDERGFYYFVDRLGDTYRWKGENVSTTQVWSVLSGAPGVVDGVVVGVLVPGADGRAGLAALVVDTAFDLVVFREVVARRLPSYARPVFLRLLTSLEYTGTFKPQKRAVQAAGFDPRAISDALFVDEPLARAYVPLDAARYAAIQEGRLRL